MIRIESIYVSKEAPNGGAMLWGKPTDKGVILMLRNKGEWQPMIMDGEDIEADLSGYLKSSEAEATYVAKEEAAETYATKQDLEAVKGDGGMTTSVSDETLILTNNQL